MRLNANSLVKRAEQFGGDRAVGARDGPRRVHRAGGPDHGLDQVERDEFVLGVPRIVLARRARRTSLPTCGPATRWPRPRPPRRGDPRRAPTAAAAREPLAAMMPSGPTAVASMSTTSAAAAAAPMPASRTEIASTSAWSSARGQAVAHRRIDREHGDVAATGQGFAAVPGRADQQDRRLRRGSARRGSTRLLRRSGRRCRRSSIRSASTCGRIGRDQHPRRHPPHRRHRGLALHEPTTRRHEAGRVAVEAAERSRRGAIRTGAARRHRYVRPSGAVRSDAPCRLQTRPGTTFSSPWPPPFPPTFN